MGAICRVCAGAGSIMSRGFPLEWWSCPCCGGAGVKIQFGPATIGERKKHHPHQQEDKANG